MNESSRRGKLQAVPVHIIGGFLGSGKSTLIQQLLQRKPPHERWAVLINEFGQIGIDQTMFDARGDVVIKGLPGGCLCCQLAFVLQAGLVNLLQRSKPDRLIIEPSGLGHPAGLLDVLRSDAFRDVLEVRDIIALLDPRRLDDPRAREHATFRDQLELADGVALSMVDVASDAQRLAARRHVEAMWPSKRWLLDAPHGQLPVEILLEGLVSEREPSLSQRGAHRPLSGTPDGVLLDSFSLHEPEPGKPRRESGRALGYMTLSWRWHAAEVFDLDRLTELLASLPRDIRVKGVWHCERGWQLYNRSDSGLALSPSGWRRDSRLELIGEQLPEAQWLEDRLMRCRIAT